MPTRGECCGCRKAPVQRYRFNVIIEDVASRKTLTQLLCADCILGGFLPVLAAQSVERTPRLELDDLRKVTTESRPLHPDAIGDVG
jgi:hypothetical protein